MFYYYYIFLGISLLLIIIISRSFILRKKNIPYNLFTEARRLENNGQFEEALLTYETALNAVNKIRFHGGLKFKIIEKLKILHTMIAYQNNTMR